MQEEIVISFRKHREIIYQLTLIDGTSHPNHNFYDQIGVKRIDKMKYDGVHLQVVDKSKLIHAMMKYNFTLHNEETSYIETSKGRRITVL
jgi:hypothetical protein